MGRFDGEEKEEEKEEDAKVFWVGGDIDELGRLQTWSGGVDTARQG